jgi:phosphoglycerol transferase MdoB-like AlkP superfamily enzyme
MKNQSYSNHERHVPAFHFFLVPLSFALVAAALVYLFVTNMRGISLFTALLLILMSFSVVMTLFLIRQFVCKVQDRVIRAEENLRHFVMTGRLLDPNLTIEQIIALRFAADDEFLMLCEKAVKENLSSKNIKLAIRNWRSDHHRV